MNKRLISGLLSAAMAMNVITILPANAFALGTESRIYEKDGYTVTYRIGSEWDNNRSVEVTIENTGEESILNWALKYDVGGEVYNLWNSKVYDSSEEYTVIKNNGYNYEIEPGHSANYGYIVKGEETVIPEDIELCSRRIDVKSGYDVNFTVTDDWHTGFNGEISIINTSDEPIEAWTLLFDGNFEINNIWNAKLLTSENRSYEAANQLWTTPIVPGESASFGFTADKSATENANADNFSLTAVVVGESTLEYPDFDDIDYELDSDSDGLPDYYEDILGTDKNNPDTDGDGLTDGYEVFYLGTDPLKADSDDNGVNDGDEDPDNDGLSNLKECELGTDSNNSDTDGDGLTDGAEVNIHKTDPLKYDTDEDGISDGDEIALGLDPNSGSTNGTPDSERTFTQTVPADSEALSAINEDEDTPFKVSLEMKAAGVAENNVYARESGYSNAIENSAILGAAPEFVYTDGLAVEEVTVKFELNNSAVNNTLGTYAAENDGYKGIKRLNVFMFFEDVNMLLPIETQYDEAKNIVSATTDRVGTYCLMDMELFFHNLGIEPSKSEDVEGSGTMSGNVENYSYHTVSELSAKSNDSVKDNFDVVFVVSEVCYDNEQLNSIKNEISTISDRIFSNSEDVTISIYGLNGLGQTQSTWYGRTDNIDGVNSMLNNVECKKISNIYNSIIISDCVDYIARAHNANSYLSERQEYCFAFFNPELKNSDSTPAFLYRAKSASTEVYGMGQLEEINKNGTNINFSTVTSSYSEVESKIYSYTKSLSKKTYGINVNPISHNTVIDDCLEHIYGEVPENTNLYKILIATDFEYISLDKPIIEKWIENYTNYGNRYIYDASVFDEEDLVDCSDTDEDGLWDFQEIKVYKGAINTPENQIISFENGTLKLPSLNEMTKEVFMDMYSNDEIYRIRESFAEKYGRDTSSEFWQMPVLPIHAHPVKKDTDGDGLDDHVDDAPFYATEIPEFFKQLIINDVVRYSEIVKISEECYLCTKNIPSIADSEFVGEYLTTENNLSYDEWEAVVSTLESNNDYCSHLSAVYVGNDVVFFAVPIDSNWDEIMSTAYSNADMHRKAIASPLLENDMSYQALKTYSARLSKECYEENRQFEESIEEKFNTNELFEVMGFFDEEGVLSSLADTGSSAFDTFYKSACRLVHSIKLKNIRCQLIATNVAYIEYAAWYRHEYPNSSFLSEVSSFIGTNVDTMAEYVVLDINDRLLQGTAESRGEVLGEMLFAILLDVSIAKALKGVNGIPDDDAVAELSDIKFKDGFDGNHAEFKSRKPYHLGNESCTLTLRPANHEALTSMLRVFDNSKKSDFIKFLSKYSDNADDIIERLSSGDGLAAKAVNSHFDDFVRYYDSYKIDFLNSIATYPQYTDDILEYAGQRGNYFVEKVIQESANGKEDLTALIARVSKQYKYSRYGKAFSYVNRSANDTTFRKTLNKYFTSDDFLYNRIINHNDTEYLDDIIKRKMIYIRESVPFPDENTLMSKVIPQGDIENYLNGKYAPKVRGFVTKADDVANCKSYMDYYNNLGLGYSWVDDTTGNILYNYYKDTDTELGVIRFKSSAVNPDTLKIPYGIGMNNVDIDGKLFTKGYKNDPLPFTGNGFAGVDTNSITPEFEFKNYIDIMDGAELYKVTKEGDEVLLAIYQKSEGKFIRLEDIK